jgi:alkylation response protein AidB-like acyl-CoA dehydrogenase
MDFQLSDVQRDLVKTARDLARDRRVRMQADAQGQMLEPDGLPRDYLRLLAERGFAGIAIPEADGGQGGSLFDAVLVIEAMAYESALAGDSIQALNFGAIQQLAHHGSPYVKEHFLGPALRGEKIVTIAMTEPEAGSAVTELRSRARVEQEEVLLQGQKVFTGHPTTADYFVVWVLFGESHRTAGAVVVERDTPGFTIDGSHRFMSGDRYGMLYFDNVTVPVENILVGENGFGKMLSVFNVERLGNSARALALGRRRWIGPWRTRRSASSSAVGWSTFRDCSGASLRWRSSWTRRGCCSIARRRTPTLGCRLRWRRRWPSWPATGRASRWQTTRCSCSAPTAMTRTPR